MENKKEVLGGLIIIVLLILVLVTYLAFYNYRKENKKDISLKDSSTATIYIYKDNSILKVDHYDKSINNDEVVGKYDCKNNDCDIYENKLINPIYDSKYIIIKENNEIFIYNYIEKTKVSNNYSNIINRKDNYLLVEKNNKYGLIDIEGDQYIDTIYDEIDVEVYNNLTKVKLDNLYGIYNIKENKEVITTKYEKINITDNKYYSVYMNNLWYVIDNNDNLVTNGYTYTFAFNKGYIAKIDNELHILKYNTNEKLSEKTISVNEKFNITRNNGIVIINTDNQTFEYDINRNNLTLK